MALSGTFVGGKNGHFGVEIDWSGVQSVANNQTTITAQVYITYWTINISSRTVTCTINGVKQTFESAAVNKQSASSATRKLVATFTQVVPHGSDGTVGAFTISASFPFKLTQTSTGNYIATLSASGTVQLDTIPRASSITSAGAVTLSDSGAACSVKWTPLATSFYYSLKFSCGNKTYSTSRLAPGTTSAYTYTGYKMTIADWAQAMPTKYSGTCTVTLYTYTSSTGDAIGSDSASFTLTLPSVAATKPSITFTGTSVNAWKANDGNTYYLQGISSYKIDATFKAGLGSYISSCSVSGTGLSLSATGSTSTTTKTLTGTSSVLSKTGEQTYTATVTDGRTNASTTKSITVYPYSKPVFSLSAVRTSNNGSVKFTYSASCSSVNSQNALKTLIIYKKSSNESTWTTVGDPISLNSISASSSITLSGFESAYSYDFKATITDARGTSTEAVASIPSEFKLINIQKNEDGTNGGVSIGKMSEEYIFDCALPARFLNNIEFGVDIQGNLKTANTTTENGAVRNVVYLQTGQDVDGGSVMGLAIHNASVYIENAANSGKVNLGSSGRKWNQLYAANGTIATSDRTKKTDITSMSDVQEQLFNQLQPVTFKFADGTSGRTHYGFISQDVENALDALNLDGQDFAGFCKDLKFDDEGKAILDEDGQKIYDYSLRYSEFIALNTFMIQKLQAENKELRMELQALKEMIADGNTSSNNMG